MLDKLIELPDQCIYGLINKPEKKIFIGWTKDLITALNRICKDIKYSNHVCKSDINKLELMIIETVSNETLLKSRYQFWYDEYCNKGYLQYRKYKAIGYKLHIDVLSKDPSDSRTMFNVYVKLRWGRSKELTVGIFNTVEECYSFVDQYYPDKNKINNIIYCNNALTNEYLCNVK